ncbi:MAG: B12-binding domain-containing radical SAM protein [Oligoflexia bacterium]|nr:B12-binding domain-containing radical SAM protein [Oligoflexia bacterium]
MTDFSLVKILLLTPPNQNKLVMERKKIINDAFGSYPPLGLLYIATYIKKKLANKAEIRIIDTSIEYKNYEELEDEIRDFSPQIVGITCMTPTLRDVKKTLHIVKCISPDTVTVIGGPHVSSFKELALSLDDADFGIFGDGELPFLQLVCALFFNEGKIDQICGLLRREGPDIVTNPGSLQQIPIDELPIPDRNFVMYDKYRCPVGAKKTMATLISSRGCPSKCTFCNSTDKLYRSRNIKKVVDEIEYLISIGFNEVFFFDDVFGITAKRILDFCAEIIKRKIHVSWGFRARVAVINEEVMMALKAAGCERIQFGIETHTNSGLKSLRKDITVDQIKMAIGLCYKYKIHSMGSFMLNLPGDSRQSILERFSFANSIGLDYVQYAILVAYNHCEIFNEGARLGYWAADLWSNFAKNPDVPMATPIFNNGLTRKELDDLLDEGLFSFYFRYKLIFQRFRNLHSPAEAWKLLKGAFNLVKIKFLQKIDLARPGQ